MIKAVNNVTVYSYPDGFHDFYYRIKDGEKFWHDKVIGIIEQLGWK